MNSTTIIVGLEHYKIIVRNLAEFCARYGPVVKQGIELYQETKKLVEQLRSFINSEAFVAFRQDITLRFRQIRDALASFGKNMLAKVRQLLDGIPPADVPSLHLTALTSVYIPAIAHILPTIRI